MALPLPAMPQRAVTSSSLDGFKLPPPTRAGTPMIFNSARTLPAVTQLTGVSGSSSAATYGPGQTLGSKNIGMVQTRVTEGERWASAHC